MRRAAARLAPALGALALALASSLAAAQPAGQKPIRIVVGFTPAGAADFVARGLAEHMGRALGVAIVVENRPGAGSSLAAEQVAKSPPDGATLFVASPSSQAVNPAMRKVPYDPVRDFTPITLLTVAPLVVAVNSQLPVNTLGELIAMAKQQPGKLNYASSGPGSAPHLAGSMFLKIAGVDIVHVPFKGGAPAIQSVMAGDTQVTFGTPPTVLPQVAGGRLRAIAVTSKQRSASVPQLPGTEESGLPDYQMSFWYGLFAPAALPKDLVQRYFDAATQAITKPELKQMLAREGMDATVSKSPEAFAEFTRSEMEFWARVVKESGAKME
jgi:tripartite-type tricarboxylate transporter receptor subunit TctC